MSDSKRSVMTVTGQSPVTVRKAALMRPLNEPELQALKLSRRQQEDSLSECGLYSLHSLTLMPRWLTWKEV